MAGRIGRQTPTTSVVLPYEKTYGQDAIELYNKSTRTAIEWQEIQACDVMAVNDEGLWTHVKYGYSVPRRNGKSEILIIRTLWGLLHGVELLGRGEKILYTAHRTTTSHASWEKVCGMLAECGLVEKEDYTTTKQFGLEKITMSKDLGGAVCCFRTRSSKGGLGEGFDTLLVDEAQEYTDDQETALKYVVTDSPNPQTIMCGTPPTAVSAGTVFMKFRKACLQGLSEDSGWAEWSVEQMSDIRDVDLWYETNPSMGFHLNERKVRAEVGADEIDFNIQRLGLWLSYNQKSAISRAEWEDLQAESLPKLTGKLFVGVKYGHNNENVALSIACKTTDGQIFVECIDCRPIRAGNDWIVQFIRKVDCQNVVIDGANGQETLSYDLDQARVKVNKVFPKVGEVITANNMFEQALAIQSIRHGDQPSVTQAVANCEKRAIGSNGGFGYKALKEGVEIAILDSIIFAHWSAVTSKEKQKQYISY